MKKSVFLWVRLFLLSVICVFVFKTTYAQKIDLDLFKNMKPRNIGPAGMSGRVTAIDVNMKNNDMIYIGTASGGVWKSETGGITWQSIFDSQKVASIGALKVDKQNPDIIWAGTGEGNPRNSQTMGAGIYKSIDGGRTWKLMGLEKTYTIHRIHIHPKNSDIVYVAAMGSAWGDNPQRGVFKTTDGGNTWKKVLYVNERTGCADMIIDPQNPNKLFAAMWEYHRDPWFFTSGGKGSGLYMTLDGGKTWKKCTKGLPNGEIGRIGLAVSPANPKRVYALVEAKKNGMYRSDDGGFSWTKTASANIGDRPFYYAELYPDPVDQNTLFNIFSTVSISIDGGKNFEQLVGWDVHPDHHAFWVNPNNPNHLLDGNDGGLNVSYDKGKTWRFISNLPLAQYYHINVDNQLPYNIYGGMQDNGSWVGPAYRWNSGGIRNADWQELFFGDGFDVIPDQSNPRYCYAMSQGGNVAHVDIKTGNTKSIKPIHPQGKELRFNWNAAIAHSPLNKTTIYFGSQYVHKSTNRGRSWEIISPDLTTNNPERQKQDQSGGLTFDVTNAENYTTITAIAPSPHNELVIWAGTDDGNLQLTKDGGKTWENVMPNVNEAPKDAWVAQIKASEHKQGEAFLVIDNHRLNDWTPYVFHTKDFGKSWTRLADENKVWGFALSIVQDPEVPQLLFLGTEFGLYVSIDYGDTWTKWENNYPTVSTMDLAIQKREKDLVIGTFGRSAYVIDDIEPLREMAKNIQSLLTKPVTVFNPPVAYMANYGRPTGERFGAHTMFEGKNRRQGAMISYFANIDSQNEKNTDDKGKRKRKNETQDVNKENNKNKKDSVAIEIADKTGKVVREIKIVPDTGLNRIYWRYDSEALRLPGQKKRKNRGGGFPVFPEDYIVKLTYKNTTDSTILTVKPDPRIEYKPMDAIKRKNALKGFIDKVSELTELNDSLNDAENSTKLVMKLIPEDADSSFKKLKDAAKAIKDSISAINESYYPSKQKKGITDKSNTIRSKLMKAYYYVGYDSGEFTETQELIIKQANTHINAYIQRIKSFFENDWKKFRELSKEYELNPFHSID